MSMMPLRTAMPITVKNPTSEPSEIVPPAANAASTPPTSAVGSVRKDTEARRQLRSAMFRSRKMPMAAAAAKPLVSGLALGVLAEDLGVVLAWVLDVGEDPLHVIRHRAEVAAANVGADVDPARGVFALDHVRGRAHPHVGDVLKTNVAAGLR